MIYAVLISTIVLFPYHIVIYIVLISVIRDCVFVHIIIVLIVVLISAIMLFPYHYSDICSAIIYDCVFSIS